jgi:hypothetical protein
MLLAVAEVVAQAFTEVQAVLAAKLMQAIGMA